MGLLTESCNVSCQLTVTRETTPHQHSCHHFCSPSSHKYHRPWLLLRLLQFVHLANDGKESSSHVTETCDCVTELNNLIANECQPCKNLLVEQDNLVGTNMNHGLLATHDCILKSANSTAWFQSFAPPPLSFKELC